MLGVTGQELLQVMVKCSVKEIGSLENISSVQFS